jgi:hypothetical protein
MPRRNRRRNFWSIRRQRLRVLERWARAGRAPAPAPAGGGTHGARPALGAAVAAPGGTEGRLRPVRSISLEVSVSTSRQWQG